MKNLSIIVPLYNKENVICKTLDLIVKKCNQESINYEILIVENESTDNSYQKTKKYIENKNDILFYLFLQTIHLENPNSNTLVKTIKI